MGTHRYCSVKVQMDLIRGNFIQTLNEVLATFCLFRFFLLMNLFIFSYEFKTLLDVGSIRTC
jgi:hypothetical protein